MTRDNEADPPSLSAEEIQSDVTKRLKKYEGLNLFEQFAMFMGVAQVFELNLKKFMHQRYGIDFDRLDRTTLGQVARSLRDRGLRPDFLKLLDSVVEYRNHIAHSLLVNQFILTELGAEEARFERRELEKGIYELEQLFFLFEWTQENNAWGEDAV
jgi:hypothetical protein